MSPAHFFPVVSHTDGFAGTQWFTSVQIVNPNAEALTITARLSAAGAIQSATFAVQAGETRGWSDFLGEVFGAEGNGALFLEAESATNQNRPPEERTFAASMRIYTEQTEGGSFGQGVPSLDPVTGFLGDWIAYFPAVALWGQPGDDGFRTNVGFWNIGADDGQLRLRILDSGGGQVWQQLVTVHRHDPIVIALPRELDLQTATLVVDSLGEWVDCAVYISVVDNITGDASFLTSQLVDRDPAEVSGGGGTAAPATPAHVRSPARLRAIFLGETQ